MTADPYTRIVRQRFADPGHAGEADGPVARTDAQGVCVELSAERAGDRLVSVRFRAKGCPHLIAACESLCIAAEGQTLSVLQGIDYEEIMRRLSVPVEKTGRILVLEDTANRLAEQLVDLAGTEPLAGV